MNNGELLAAIDIGSNSFRLEVAKCVNGYIERVDYLKETVRLGANLNDNKALSQDAMDRGWACLARFGERIRGFSPNNVTAMATQTLREASNRSVFVAKGQQYLGFDIDVIAGQEEARLIYQGVAHNLPDDSRPRMVIDIGGRSTEFMLGQGLRSSALASYKVGSVSWSQRYFANGQLTPQAFNNATVAAKALLEETLGTFSKAHWATAYGSSGTVGAVDEVLRANGRGATGISHSDLQWLITKLCDYKYSEDVDIAGIKADRRPVIGGGVSILKAIFELFDIDTMLVAKGALRHGALQDLVKRDTPGGELRHHTVDYLMQRFNVDALQASRVSQTALHLFDQVDTPQTGLKSARQRLIWASKLHEIGSIVSHNDLPIHGAYMLGHVDAPGFSIDELHVLSQLVLGQRGKLKKVDAMLVNASFAKKLLCLRLACLLCHARKTPELNTLKLRCDADGYTLKLHPTWAQHYPQSIWLLEEEVKYWARTETLLHIEGL